MNTGLIELVFILDRSGSMGGLERDTINGFNRMISRQKEQKIKANVTTILFDDVVDIIHDRFPLEIIALLDAVGIAIEKMENVQQHLPEDYRARKIIFVITTDGLENSSERFAQEQIRRKIEAKKECGWEFMFLGANIDAGKEAEKIGIARNRSVTYKNDSEGITINFRAVENALCKAISCDTRQEFIEDDWKKEIERYREKVM